MTHRLKVHIDKPVTIYWAAADLPNNRTITIEIYETTFNLEIAEKIFMKMIDSLNFDEDNLVKTGAAFVADIKSKGIDSLINSSNIQSCFFLAVPIPRSRNLFFVAMKLLINLSGKPGLIQDTARQAK